MRCRQGGGKLLTAAVLLGEALFLVPLFLHRSFEPWILGRYSLPYAVLLAAALGAATFVGALVLRWRSRGLRIALAIAVLVGLALGLAEGAGQLWASLHPGYTVVFLAPDRALGWKQAPGLHWTWTGGYWYAREFSVEIETNAHGFRDRERQFAKPEGCARIALLGDSFVEAIQVPLESTAASCLERALNVRAKATGSASHFEVLNFGISNYGVGQYLLVWEEWARHFAPDVVFCFIAPLQLNRTPDRFVTGAFGTTRRQRLWMRPTFRLEGRTLVREPPADYDTFVSTQEQTLRTAFGGQRSVRVPRRWFLTEFTRATHDALLQVQRRAVATRDTTPPSPAVDEAVLAVNLAILDELQCAAARAGTLLVIVDASRYLSSDGEDCSRSLTAFCAEHGAGYVALGEDLLRANSAGISTKWSHDGHFNEAGNAIFAEALERWLETSGTLRRLLDRE